MYNFCAIETNYYIILMYNLLTFLVMIGFGLVLVSERAYSFLEELYSKFSRPHIQVNGYISRSY